ncbi:MAG: LytR C-terminal domain-containing protein [Microbacteriaceae bacterium]
MAKFPEDPFDDFPEDLARVGAHRAPKKRGGGWVGFAWAALATGLLVIGGLYATSLINNEISFEIPGFVEEPVVETPTPTPTPTAEALTDPTLIDPARLITITVLNGTPLVGLQNTASDSLTALGWPVVSAAKASTTDIEETLVYYSNPADEDIARGLVLALGVGDVRESTAFLGAPVTVVLGADYGPPVAP